MSSASVRPRSVGGGALRSEWLLAGAFTFLAVPTLITLGNQVWSREAGAHGPIILAAGAWLLWRQTGNLKSDAQAGSPLLTALVMITGLGLYIFGRAYDFISLETAGLYGAGVGILHAKFGLRAVLRNWFPFLYLAFTIPPPVWLIDRITAPLKHFVSFVSTDALSLAGLPIAREGVTIFVAQYQLLVEDACSGMNSIIGLIAVSLLYVYLVRGAIWWYAALIAVLAVPIAVIANILRIVVLILLTYFFGDDVAQGFLHFTAGILLFATALVLVFAVDSVIFPLLRGRARAAA